MLSSVTIDPAPSSSSSSPSTASITYISSSPREAKEQKEEHLLEELVLRQHQLESKAIECSDWKRHYEHMRSVRAAFERENVQLRDEVMRLRGEMASLRCSAARASKCRKIDFNKAEMWLSCRRVQSLSSGTRKWKRSSIFLAAQDGALNELMYLLCYLEYDGAYTDREGRTCAHYAAKEGHLGVIKLLSEIGFLQLGTVDQRGNSFAHYASKRGHVHILEWLYNTYGAAAVTSATNGNGGTISHSATSRGATKCLRFLLKHGCLQETKRDKRGRDLTIVAASNGQVEALQWLHKRGLLDSTSVDKDGRNAAHIAADKDQLRVLQYLHGIGAVDARARDVEGRTVAQLAEGRKCRNWLKDNGLAYFPRSPV